MASTFLVIYSASLSRSDDFVLFDSLDGNGSYSQMFYAIFQFCAQVKFATLDGNPAIVHQSFLLKSLSKVIFALARTAKYERILNVLALVAQNKQPCRSERLALLTDTQTNRHTHTNKHTRQREAGRIRGESRWTERASVSPHPHVSYVVPSVPSRHGPPTPGTRTRTHSGIHAHAFHISHPMSPGYDTNNFPHPLCSHVTIRTTDAGRCTSL